MNTEDSKAEAEQLSYLNITISQKGVAEFSGKRRIVFIPKEKIRRIDTRFGSRAERPLIQSIAGFVLIGFGLVGLKLLITAGASFWRWEAGFLLFGGMGGWLVFEALQKRHYLLVRCPDDRRKLVFDRKVDHAKLDDFAKDARRFGYDFN